MLDDIEGKDEVYGIQSDAEEEEQFKLIRDYELAVQKNRLP
jgi:hypothetical protein